MKKLILLTILSYSNIKAGYLYDLNFKVDALHCTKDKIKIPSSFTCKGINGSGTVTYNDEGLWLVWTKELEKQGESSIIERF